MVRIIISILLIFIGFQSHSQIAMFHAHNQAVCTYLDADAKRFIDSVNVYITLTCEQQLIIDTLVRDLKGQSNPRYSTSNVWDSLLAIYPIIGGDANAHAFNLKDPSTYKMTWVNSPTHASTGVDFNGTSQYGNTNLIPSTTGFITLNSMHLAYYSRENIAGNEREMGGYVDVNSVSRVIMRFSGFSFMNINSAGGSTNILTDTRGFVLSSRVASGSIQIYQNGSLFQSAARISSVLCNGTITVGAQATGTSPVTIDGYTTKECAFSSIGKGLTATQHSNYYNSVQAYNQRLSRNVGSNIF